MPSPLAADARRLDDAALGEAVNEAYRELFNLQFQKGTRQLQDTTAVRRARRQIARLRTILRERQLAAVAGAPLAPLAEPAEPVISPQKQRALEERRQRDAAARAETEADAAPSPAAAADEALENIDLARPDNGGSVVTDDSPDADAPGKEAD